jgi:hypothetical protein
MKEFNIILTRLTVVKLHLLSFLHTISRSIHRKNEIFSVYRYPNPYRTLDLQPSTVKCVDNDYYS